MLKRQWLVFFRVQFALVNICKSNNNNNKKKTSCLLQLLSLKPLLKCFFEKVFSSKGHILGDLS